MGCVSSKSVNHANTASIQPTQSQHNNTALHIDTHTHTHPIDTTGLRNSNSATSPLQRSPLLQVTSLSIVPSSLPAVYSPRSPSSPTLPITSHTNTLQSPIFSHNLSTNLHDSINAAVEDNSNIQNNAPLHISTNKQALNGVAEDEGADADADIEGDPSGTSMDLRTPMTPTPTLSDRRFNNGLSYDYSTQHHHHQHHQSQGHSNQPHKRQRSYTRDFIKATTVARDDIESSVYATHHVDVEDNDEQEHGENDMNGFLSTSPTYVKPARRQSHPSQSNVHRHDGSDKHTDSIDAQSIVSSNRLLDDLGSDMDVYVNEFKLALGVNRSSLSVNEVRNLLGKLHVLRVEDIEAAIHQHNNNSATVTFPQLLQAYASIVQKYDPSRSGNGTDYDHRDLHALQNHQDGALHADVKDSKEIHSPVNQHTAQAPLPSHAAHKSARTLSVHRLTNSYKKKQQQTQLQGQGQRDDSAYRNSYVLPDTLLQELKQSFDKHCVDVNGNAATASNHALTSSPRIHIPLHGLKRHSKNDASSATLNNNAYISFTDALAIIRAHYTPPSSVIDTIMNFFTSSAKPYITASEFVSALKKIRRYREMKQRFKQKVYDRSVAAHHSHRSQHQHSGHAEHRRAQSNDLHTRRSSVTAYERSQLASHLQVQRTPEHSVVLNNPSGDVQHSSQGGRHLYAHAHMACATPSTLAEKQSQRVEAHKHSNTHDSIVFTGSQRSRTNQLSVQDVSSSASAATSPRHSLNTDQITAMGDSVKGPTRSVDSIS